MEKQDKENKDSDYEQGEDKQDSDYEPVSGNEDATSDGDGMATSDGDGMATSDGDGMATSDGDGMATSEDEGYSTAEDALGMDKDTNSFKRDRFQNEMKTLHRELEIALPHITKSNRMKRKIPRAQRPYYTKKTETARKGRSRKPRPQECGEGEIEGSEKGVTFGNGCCLSLDSFKGR